MNIIGIIGAMPSELADIRKTLRVRQLLSIQALSFI